MRHICNVLRQLFLWLVLFYKQCVVQTYDLYSIRPTNASVYASSLGPNVSPNFAVDQDFYLPEPTCFQWEVGARNPNWILIDFGLNLRRIAEIRIVLGPTAVSPSDTINIDAYITPNLPQLPKQSFNREQANTHNLSWAEFQHCHSYPVTSKSTPQTISLPCANLTDARWLVIRSASQALRICLINVYIASAFDSCFKSIDPQYGHRLHGTVYRSIRHISRQDCYDHCMRSSLCEVTRFTKRRFSGNCELIHAFQAIDSRLDPRTKATVLHCPAETCHLDINYCNRGTRVNLNQQTLSKPAVNSLIQEWLVDPKTGGQNSNDAVRMEFLSSIHFTGYLNCSDWDCGLIFIYSVNKDGEETLCTHINTKEVTQLTNFPLLCDPFVPIPHLIRLRWRSPEPTLPQMVSVFSDGYVRFTSERLEEVLKELTGRVSTVEIPPKAGTTINPKTTTEHAVGMTSADIETTVFANALQAEELVNDKFLRVSNQSVWNGGDSNEENLASLYFTQYLNHTEAPTSEDVSSHEERTEDKHSIIFVNDQHQSDSIMNEKLYVDNRRGEGETPDAKLEPTHVVHKLKRAHENSKASGRTWSFYVSQLTLFTFFCKQI